jgi:hypothetical protein
LWHRTGEWFHFLCLCVCFRLWNSSPRGGEGLNRLFSPALRTGRLLLPLAFLQPALASTPFPPSAASVGTEVMDRNSFASENNSTTNLRVRPPQPLWRPGKIRSGAQRSLRYETLASQPWPKVGIYGGPRRNTADTVTLGGESIHAGHGLAGKHRIETNCSRQSLLSVRLALMALRGVDWSLRLLRRMKLLQRLILRCGPRSPRRQDPGNRYRCCCDAIDGAAIAEVAD